MILAAVGLVAAVWQSRRRRQKNHDVILALQQAVQSLRRENAASSTNGVALEDRPGTASDVVQHAASDPALFGVVNMLYHSGPTSYEIPLESPNMLQRSSMHQNATYQSGPDAGKPACHGVNRMYKPAGSTSAV